VELRDDGRPQRPVKAYETCKLKHHYVGDACIAYGQPDVASELMRMASAAAK
jgi:hypothetical protein